MEPLENSITDAIDECFEQTLKNKEFDTAMNILIESINKIRDIIPDDKLYLIKDWDSADGTRQEIYNRALYLKGFNDGLRLKGGR